MQKAAQLFPSVGSCSGCLLFALPDSLSTHPLPDREAGPFGCHEHTLMGSGFWLGSAAVGISRTWRWRAQREVEIFITPTCSLPTQEGCLHPTSSGGSFLIATLWVLQISLCKTLQARSIHCWILQNSKISNSNPLSLPNQKFSNDDLLQK